MVSPAQIACLPPQIPLRIRSSNYSKNNWMCKSDRLSTLATPGICGRTTGARRRIGLWSQSIITFPTNLASVLRGHHEIDRKPSPRSVFCRSEPGPGPISANSQLRSVCGLGLWHACLHNSVLKTGGRTTVAGSYRENAPLRTSGR
jgi:hypothetical protein